MSNLLKIITADSPIAWQIGFQSSASPFMEGIILLHHYIFSYLVLVFVVVMWFLIKSIYKFNEANHPRALEFNHDPVIEAVWTIAPAFILIAIATPSFSLLYSMDELIAPAFTVKVVGHQWYWSYEIDVSSAYNLSSYLKLHLPESKPFKQLVREYPELAKLADKLAKQPYNKITRTWIGRHFPEVFICRGKQGLLNIDRLVIDATEHNASLFQYSSKLASVLRAIGIDIKQPVQFVNLYWEQFSIFLPYYEIKNSIVWVSPTITFDSYMLPESDLPAGGLRLLEVDNRLVLPILTHIRVLVTSVDVIHSWSVPSLGVKLDAIPGRLNQTDLYIKRVGVFYGQCSELCGVNHAFMPIVVQSVEYSDFIDWVSQKTYPRTFADLLKGEIKVKY